MKVPLLDLTRENQPLLEEINSVIQPMMASSQFVLGPSVAEFEQQAARFLELGDDFFALGVSSGTDALLLALMASEVEAGSEVITTPFTFFATAGTIHRAGMKPLFVDIDESSFNLDVSQAAEVKSDRVKVLMPVHLYGQAADIAAMRKLADERGWLLVEDAAQALGARFNAQPVGKFGDFAGYSFYPTKNLGAFGDAGLLVGRKQYEEKATRMRVHGMKNRYEYLDIGGNFRLDSIQAAVLSVKLKYLNEWQAARRSNAARYSELLGEDSLQEHITLPQEMPGCFHTYNQFVIRVKNGRRDALIEYLNNNEIGNVVFYPSPLHLEKSFAYLGYKKGDFPRAELACSEVLALPIYPFLKKEELEFVADKILQFFK